MKKVILFISMFAMTLTTTYVFAKIKIIAPPERKYTVILDEFYGPTGTYTVTNHTEHRDGTITAAGFGITERGNNHNHYCYTDTRETACTFEAAR